MSEVLYWFTFYPLAVKNLGAMIASRQELLIGYRPYRSAPCARVLCAQCQLNNRGVFPVSPILDEVLSANAVYQATFGDKASLPAPPARRIAILTCMDARLDPLHFAGLRLGDAHIMRNAGGRASDDAIRSLVLSHKLMGTNEWFVIHHTQCGLLSITNDQVRALLAESLDTAVADADGWRNVTSGGGSRAGEYINWLTFTDARQCIVDDVTRLRTHPLVPGNIPVYGYIYDVATGALVEVAEATAAGRPR